MRAICSLPGQAECPDGTFAHLSTVLIDGGQRLRTVPPCSSRPPCLLQVTPFSPPGNSTALVSCTSAGDVTCHAVRDNGTCPLGTAPYIGIRNIDSYLCDLDSGSAFPSLPL